MGGRPVRWAPRARLVGDYDGREQTLDVFFANADLQRSLYRGLRGMRAELEAAVGGPFIIIFHTDAETHRLYPEVLSSRHALRGVRVNAQGGAWAVHVSLGRSDSGCADFVTHGDLRAVLPREAA
jgi:hypothetical protein